MNRCELEHTCFTILCSGDPIHVPIDDNIGGLSTEVVEATSLAAAVQSQNSLLRRFRPSQSSHEWGSGDEAVSVSVSTRELPSVDAAAAAAVLYHGI